MAFEPKDNSGALFKNEKREKDTHPNATGSAMIDGVEYFVSAWTKEGKKGKFQSLSFKRKDAQPQKAPPRQSYGEASGRQRTSYDDRDNRDGYDDRDLPF